MSNSIKIQISELRLRKAIQNKLYESTNQQLDLEYLQAIQAGDLKKASVMVRAAFKAAYPNNKIVDDNDEPIVLYHGTGTGDFTRFEHGHDIVSNDIADIGFWFTPSEGFASNFVDNGWRHKGKRVMSVFLVSNNPKIYSSVDKKAADEAYANIGQLKDFARKSYETLVNKLTNIPYPRSVFGYAVRKEMSDLFYSVSHEEDGYFYRKLTPEQKAVVDTVAAEFKTIVDKWRQAQADYKATYAYGDSYQKFQTDIYRYGGQSAEEANFGGIGMSLNNPKETKAAYLDSLAKEGHDGIIIKDTSYDSSIAGGDNDQYVVFNANQIKSAAPVTYDDQGNIIPLSRRFTDNDDIRYEEE